MSMQLFSLIAIPPPHVIEHSDQGCQIVQPFEGNCNILQYKIEPYLREVHLTHEAMFIQGCKRGHWSLPTWRVGSLPKRRAGKSPTLFLWGLETCRHPQFQGFESCRQNCILYRLEISAPSRIITLLEFKSLLHLKPMIYSQADALT